MKPITYTYDWGMVTDLGRRNISRMCSKLGVENIIVLYANISKKRENIRMNLSAWLKNPHLGMIALLTAGDKHFFRHVETVKKQTNINLNLWSVNPLEVTHFKTGFLGIKPDFEERVYSNGVLKQLEYHLKEQERCLIVLVILIHLYGTHFLVSTTEVLPRKKTTIIYLIIGDGMKKL